MATAAQWIFEGLEYIRAPIDVGLLQHHGRPNKPLLVMITVAKVAGVFQKHPEVDALKDVLEELVNQGERFLETDRDSIVSAYSEACITAASNPRLKKADAKTYLKQSANAQLQWESIPVQEILRNLRLQEERERVRADTRTHVADNFIEVNQDFILRNTKRPHEDNVVNIPTAQRHRNALVYEYRKTNRSNRLPYHNILVKGTPSLWRKTAKIFKSHINAELKPSISPSTGLAYLSKLQMDPQEQQKLEILMSQVFVIGANEVFARAGLPPEFIYPEFAHLVEIMHSL
ncbi:hypothetical protein HDU90_003051 [Geranomyces variabilis]|nr:hypothetical protein HDU90_003051 [Geranomyces variabilis]